MKRLFFIIIVLILVSHGRPSANQPSLEEAPNIKPFKLVVYNSDYSMGYALKYVLTNKSLEIIFKGELKEEKDSTLFKTTLKANKELKRISNMNIDSLQEYYSNPCIRDGSQITVELKKGFKNKMIHLSNYYQPDIGLAIELINSLVSKKYKIWYDKETLIRDQEKCK